MSLSPRTVIILAIIVIAVAGGCLLWQQTHDKAMSYTAPVDFASDLATSTVASTSVIIATTTQKSAESTSTSVDAQDVTIVSGISFEIATSTSKQEQGLSGRAVIPDNYAMLFVFSHDDTYGFWMKDMLAPLDMIWLSDNGTIVLITHDALPSSYPNVFYPPVPIRYVLETRVGLAAKKGWVIGSRIPLPLPYGE